MRLVSLEISGYRRFDEKQTLNLDARVVALLGPNEAGKTSILKALQLLGRRNAFTLTGPSQETTRGKTIATDDIILCAKYLPEKNDFKAFSAIPEAKDLRWIIQNTHANGKIVYSFVPEIKRDTALRIGLRTRLIEHLKNPTKKLADHLIDSTIQAAVAALEDTETEVLPSGALDKLRTLSEFLKTAGHGDLSSDVENLISIESTDAPSKELGKNIPRLIPRYVEFHEQDRDLQSTYDLNSYYGDKKSNLPKALSNLAAAAELDLMALHSALRENDRGLARSMLDHAQDTLRTKLRRAWTQSNVYVTLDADNQILNILGGDNKDWRLLADRSAGFRQFVALFAFLEQAKLLGGNVVLLIDEAETHLHYDAQANLMQMLASQTLTSQVIITTHSIGCLPEDLALGIRFIQPKDDGKTSRIENKSWSKGGVGLSPILFGMGAATMAFIPVRRCVLTEGATDMILLPALLREAMEVDTLGFQIAPGLAECKAERIAVMQNEGSRVAFLVDGDPGGSKIEKAIIDAGVSEDRILRHFLPDNSRCVVEDFLMPEVYVEAVNAELQRSGRPTRISAEDLSETQRPNAVDKWCKENGFPPPNKVDIAYRVLEQIHARKLVANDRKAPLVTLYNQISALFT